MRSVSLLIAVSGAGGVLASCASIETLVESVRKDYRHVATPGDAAPRARTGAPESGPAQEGFDAATGLWTAEVAGMAPVAAKQKNDSWCWAACAAMIHAKHGTRGAGGGALTQDVIAARITGVGDPDSPEARTAGHYEVMWALNPDLPYSMPERVAGVVGKMAAARSVEIQFDSVAFVESRLRGMTSSVDTMIPEIQAGHPVVAGLRHLDDPASGHCYLVYGARYRKSEAKESVVGIASAVAPDYDWAARRVVVGTYVLDAALVIDPMTGETSEIAGEEFVRRADFMIGKKEAREILEQELGAVAVR